MSFDKPTAIALVIANEVMMYTTLPLHVRLLYVLLKPGSKKDLDPSFHTLMVNSTIVNLIFALDCCLILEPSASGIFFDFYEMMGPYFAPIELIKTTVLLNVASMLHLLLAVNRFSAIAFPLVHQHWWRGSRLFWFCVVMWIVSFVVSIPLMLPGSTGHTLGVNLYGVRSVEFTFKGNYYFIYSMGSAFLTIGLEILCLIFYVGMIIKFNDFRKYSKSGVADVKRMTRGVMRTTLASVCISMGQWCLVVFALMIYISYWTRGVGILSGNYFSATLRFINAFKNVITPWVMIGAFRNIRYLVFGSSKANLERKVTTVNSSVVKFLKCYKFTLDKLFANGQA